MNIYLNCQKGVPLLTQRNNVDSSATFRLFKKTQYSYYATIRYSAFSIKEIVFSIVY